ncbi:CARDB domain-containing protein [Vibrio vulnificus]|uniref:CARDB domain-containing protein n=1 Tax=Vibrio vulnificus TaxID=672 RepID=UPI0030EE9111
MNSRYINNAAVLIFSIVAFNSISAPNTNFVTIDGKNWAQPADFVNLSWNDINSVCPEAIGGVCGAGQLNGIDMSGWVWASINEVGDLFISPVFGIPDAVLIENDGRVQEVDSTWAPLFLSYFNTTTSDSSYIHAVTGWTRTKVSSSVAYRGLVYQHLRGSPDSAETNLQTLLGDRSTSSGAWFYHSDTSLGIDLSPWKNEAGPNTGLTSDITLSASPLQDLVPVQVDVEICNYGDETVTSDAFAPIQARLFSSQADLVTDGDLNDVKSLADGVSLAPGACANLSFTWTPDITQSVAEIQVEANAYLTVPESNLGNNSTTRAVVFDQQPPSVPEYSCDGFYEPFDDKITIKKKSKGTIPVKMELTNEYSYPMTDADISAPPVINITFNSTVYGNGITDDAALESVGASNEGNQFSYNAAEGQWEYRLGTKQFSSAGTYQVTVASGDTGEYTISNGALCSQSFIRQE